MNREMVVSKTPWVYEYPAEWKQVPLRALFGEHKNKNKDGDEHNLLSLSYGNIIRKDINTNEGLLPESFNGYNIVDKEDIVLRLTDLQNDHRSLRTGLVTERGIITSAYLVLRKKTSLSSEYYHYLLHAFDIMKVFYSMGEGIRQSLGYDELSYVIIPQPSLEEQNAIVRYLSSKCSAIDDTIEKHKKIIEKLDLYFSSEINRTVYEGVSGEKCTDRKKWFNRIPNDWESKRLKYILSERNERSIYGTETPLSMSQKAGIIPTDEMDSVPHTAQSFVNAKIVYPNDLVFNKLKAHLGVFSVSAYHGVVSPDYAVYSAKPEVNVRYFEYIFKTPACIGEFIKRYTGIGQGLMRLYTDELFDIECPCPPISVQNEIAQYLDNKRAAIFEAKQKHSNIIEKLEEYKKSIIYNAVTGRIDCREEQL